MALRSDEQFFCEKELVAKAAFFSGPGINALARGEVNEETLDVAARDICRIVDRSYVNFGRITAEQRTMFRLKELIFAARIQRGMPVVPKTMPMTMHDMWEKPSYEQQ